MLRVKPYLQRIVSLGRTQHGRISDPGVCLIEEGMEGFLDTCRERGLLEGNVNWYRYGLKGFYSGFAGKKCFDPLHDWEFQRYLFEKICDADTEKRLRCAGDL